MRLYFCVLEVCQIQLLSISTGIVRSLVRDWTQYSQLSVHTIEKITSNPKVIFSAGMWFYLFIQKQMDCKKCWAQGLSRNGRLWNRDLATGKILLS